MICINYYIRKKYSLQYREGSEQYLNVGKGSDWRIRLKEDEVGRRVARYSLAVLQLSSLQICSFIPVREVSGQPETKFVNSPVFRATPKELKVRSQAKREAITHP